MPQRRKREGYLWIGGALCLDFSNTQSFRPTTTPLDRLDSYDHLLDWAGFAELLATRRLRELRVEAEQHPRAAKAALTKAKTLREAVYRICSRHAGGDKVQPSDLDELNLVVHAARNYQRLVDASGSFRWQWKTTNELTQVLWPIALSAAELLVSDHMCWVRECSLETCSALFLDSSKNKKRRWCDMKDCGNLAKARIHRARKRSHPSS